MANILIMDDEPLSLRRLFNVLCDQRQHSLETASNLVNGVKVVEKRGSALDLLIIDLSIFQQSAADLLSLFASACPDANVLVLSPLPKKSPGLRYPLLRKPFTDANFVEAVDRVLGLSKEPELERATHRAPKREFGTAHRPRALRVAGG